jgi:hypothetical protein
VKPLKDVVTYLMRHGRKYKGIEKQSFSNVDRERPQNVVAVPCWGHIPTLDHIFNFCYSLPGKKQVPSCHQNFGRIQ